MERAARLAIRRGVVLNPQLRAKGRRSNRHHGLLRELIDGEAATAARAHEQCRNHAQRNPERLVRFSSARGNGPVGPSRAPLGAVTVTSRARPASRQRRLRSITAITCIAACRRVAPPSIAARTRLLPITGSAAIPILSLTPAGAPEGTLGVRAVTGLPAPRPALTLLRPPPPIVLGTVASWQVQSSLPRHATRAR